MTDLPMRFEPGAPLAERIIALELNELCPELLDRWMAEGILPNFKALHEESAVRVTRRGHDDAMGKTLPFGSLFYQIEAIKSGRHHPDGCLWIQTGAHHRFEHSCSILDILPTLMEMLGLPAPLGTRGTSLLPQLARA